MYTCHLQRSHLLKARTYPSSVKRSLYKRRWIRIAIGYVRVCRVYTFISLPVSSVSVMSRIRIGRQKIPTSTAAFLISPLRVTHSGYIQ